jgi:hypothetical protein
MIKLTNLTSMPFIEWLLLLIVVINRKSTRFKLFAASISHLIFVSNWIAYSQSKAQRILEHNNHPGHVIGIQ